MTSHKFCTECGTANAGGKFCTECGTNLSAEEFLNADTLGVSENSVEEWEDDEYEEEETDAIPTIGSGLWVVGQDISPGLYRYAGYFERKDRQGNIINNSTAYEGLGLEKVLATDFAIQISGEAVDIDDYPVYSVLGNMPLGGRYIIGVDIPPGTYRVSSAADSGAYFELLDQNMRLIDNGFSSGGVMANVTNSAFAFGYKGQLQRL